MSLNKQQQAAYDAIVRNNEPIVYLTGSAGTGKSYTVAQIISQFNYVALTATSHQAKAILAQLTGRFTSTVHSYFGYVLKNHNYKQVLIKRDNFEQEPTTLCVIDEVSMLPNKILKEALEQVGTVYDQLLLVGDAVQLPAVSNKPNLKLLDKYKIELTEQMRQDSCPILANYLNSYRRAIETNTMPASLFTDAPAITLFDSHRDFCRQYLLTEGNKKIIAYRNNVVDKYNQTLVEGNDFNPGDVVIIDKPIPKHANNQDEVTILSVHDTEDYYNITVRCNDGYTTTVRHYKLVSKFNAELERFKTLKDEDSFWELYNKSFRLKHVYACTIHKSQGSSIDSVFVDALDFINAFQATKTKYNNPISQDMFLRLMYVAISRMSKHCYIYTGNDGKGRSYDILEESAQQAEKNLARIKPEPKPKELPSRWSL